MESGHSTGSGVDLRKQQEFSPCSTPKFASYSQSELHDTSSLTKKEDANTIQIVNNPYVESHPSPLANNTNPFLLPSDTTNTIATISENEHQNAPFEPGLYQPFSTSFSTTQHSSTTGEMLGIPSSSAPSSHESSSLGNPFDMPTSMCSNTPNAGAAVSQKVDENHDQRDCSMSSHDTTHDFSSSQQLDPLLGDAIDKNNQNGSNVPTNIESTHHALSVTEQGHHTIDTNATPKLGIMNSQVASESSNGVPRTNNASEIQNPTPQVMDRGAEDPATSSAYMFPDYVFERNQSNTEWSNASGESLFSIPMGNTSFCRDMVSFSKSGELDRPGDMYMASSCSNQPPLPPEAPQQPRANKFHDISQSTTEQQQGSLKVTEENAAETMREVIMEETMKKYDSIDNGVTTTHRLSNYNNGRSLRSNGSTKSFAFKVLTDGDKTSPRKGSEEKIKSQKQSEQQQKIPETPQAAQTPKSVPNASQNKWLSCFKCCQ